MNERVSEEAGADRCAVISCPKDTARLLKKRKDNLPRGATDTEGTSKSREGQSAAATETYLGDIAIAPETARRYAKKNGRSLSNELRVLILHGVLHLLGYDHETDRGEMNRIERKMRRRFGLA